MKRNLVTSNGIVALSLASIWFAHEFQQLLFPGDHYYFEADAPRSIDAVAILLCVVVMTLVFFTALTLFETAKTIWLKKMVGGAFFLLGVAAFGSLSHTVIGWFFPEAGTFVNAPLPLLVLSACLALSYRRQFELAGIVSILRSIALIAAPLGLLLCGQTLVLLGKTFAGPSPLQVIERGAIKNADSKVKNRVIWIIFDELGYSTFIKRPESVKMPAFDRLMSESFVAENAFPPNYYTRDSIPALLTGSPIKVSRPVADNELKLFPTGGTPPVLLSETENVITDVKEMGGNAAIVGWYHPYPRLFPKALSYGYFRTIFPPTCFDITRCSVETFSRAFETIPLFRRFLWVFDSSQYSEANANNSQIARHVYLRDRSLKIATDPDIDLLYLHFSIPHWPFINKMDAPAHRGYYGSLEAVDKTFEEIRERLTQTGEWENTAVIISGDHWWRAKREKDFMHLPETERKPAADDTRIPFIVKLPHQKTGGSYAPAFNTLITRYLIREIMRGNINTPSDLTAWLSNMRRDRPDLMDFRPERPNGDSRQLYD